MGSGIEGNRPPREHQFERIDDRPDSINELEHCKVCRCAEGTLPQECPGEPVDGDKQDMIMDNLLEYFRGKWWVPVATRLPNHRQQHDHVFSEITVVGDPVKSYRCECGAVK